MTEMMFVACHDRMFAVETMTVLSLLSRNLFFSVCLKGVEIDVGE